MIASLLAFTAPSIDFHAFAPEIVVVGVLVLVLIVDLVTDEGSAWAPSIASLGLLAALIPIITLATTEHEVSMFGGAYMVDNFSLVLKALFVVTTYLVVLLSMNYIGEGDYWEGEYYQLLIAALLGMMIMASARDLITMFIALELLSIPAYMLAAWKKSALKGNEAGIKYYLMGVFASAVMLYGMSMIYGITGSTLLTEIAEAVGRPETSTPIITLSIVFVLVGFAFKVSAVPFHSWAPDTYEGAPTPVTTFLAVASKTAGFVALMTLVFVGFRTRADVFQPMMWALAVVTMFVGNLIALRQTNVVRMLAYSGVAQAGYMLAPFAVYGYDSVTSMALSSIVAYLLVYMVMNVGAFAVVIALARKTGSAELSAFSGMREFAPGLTFAMTIFLFSLAGIPPLGGWFAKFAIFQVLVSSESPWGYSLAVIVGVNSVIALFYYARVAKAMWMEPVLDGDLTPVKVPVSQVTVLIVTAVATVAIGVYPSMVTRFSSSTCLIADPVECPADTAAP